MAIKKRQRKDLQHHGVSVAWLNLVWLCKTCDVLATVTVLLGTQNIYFKLLEN
jgi:hypothetical protein